jgi:tRNA (Thr-GGU) A37 N-methylase
MDSIKMNPIGIVRSPYKQDKGIPIQGVFKQDVLDGAPVLDIKPYVKYFDSRKDVKCGWLDKHFRDHNTPDKTLL